MQMGVKQVDDQMLRQQFDDTYRNRFIYATASAKDIWHKFERSLFKKDTYEYKEIKKEIENCENNSLYELCIALEKINPRAALELSFGEHNERLCDYKTPKGKEVFSLSRGVWLIGVFGNGQKATQYDALSVFNKYVRWCATYLMELEINYLTDENDIDSHLANLIGINRLCEPETRIPWITDEITREIGDWSEENSEICSISDILNHRIATRINKNVEKARNAMAVVKSKGTSSMSEALSDMLLRGIPNDIVDKLTASHRPISSANIRNVFSSNIPTYFPFVNIDNKYRVLDVSAWMSQREDALFHLCMQASLKDEQGKVFEDVTASLLQKWGPDDINWQTSVHLTNSKGSRKHDEIDVFGKSTQTAFIAECKANRNLSEKNSSVVANFESNVLTKAASQLTTRIMHWNSGWRPSEFGDIFSDDSMGFIVTFSSYGGLPWNAAVLEDKESWGKFGIFPLYSLILAISILVKSVDFMDYLSFRLNSINKGVKNFDELEYIFFFLRGMNNEINDLQDDALIIFRQYKLDDGGTRIDPRKYKNKRNWKKLFARDLWENRVPVTPPICGGPICL